MTRSRRLRWVGAGAVAVVLALSAAGAVAASAGGRTAHRSASRGCYSRGSVTIAQDKAGRFYYFSKAPRSAQHAPWYVCAFKQGTSRKLPYTGNPDSGIPWEPGAKVSGRYVAFFVVAPGPGGVAVFDMVTGHSTFSRIGGIGESAWHDSLVLKANGSVAWTSSVGVSPTEPWEVRRHDSTGTAIVDSGPQVDPKSLAAGGSWLYWTNAGSPRSAPFH